MIWRVSILSSFAFLLLLAAAPDAAQAQDLVINEFMADPNGSTNTDLNGNGEAGTDDEFVEILNSGSAQVDLSGYQLDDVAGGSSPYNFPDGAVLAPGEYAVVIGSANGQTFGAFTGSGVPSLNNGGDDIRLLDDTGQVVASVSYTASQATEGISQARNPDGTGDFEAQNTFGEQPSETAGQNNNTGTGNTSDNDSGGGGGGGTPSDAPLAINEFLADPTGDDSGVDLNDDGTADSDDEFVEIVNIGDSPVSLSGATITDEASNRYTFPEGVTLEPGEGAVIVGDTVPASGIPAAFVGDGLPGLNNGGDTIILTGAGGGEIQRVAYGSSGSAPTQGGVSSARNPNGTGSFEPQTAFGAMASESAGQNNETGGPLPVEFAGAPQAFVDGETVTLRWATLTEENNLGFHVQHRRRTAANADASGPSGGGWTTSAARVAGAGHSSAEQRYDHTVTGLAPGRYAFRVMQVDADDTRSFSQTVEATVRAGGGGFALRPPSQNPFRSRTVLAYATAEDERNLKATLYNSLGQRVRALRLAEGRIEVRASGLASGVYFVRLEAEDHTAVQSITLVR